MAKQCNCDLDMFGPSHWSTHDTMTSANQHFPKLRSSSALEEQKIPPADCGGLTETVNLFLSFVKHEVLEEYTISAIHFVTPVFAFNFSVKTPLT